MIILFILIILILLSLVLIECNTWQGRVGGVVNKISLKKGGAGNDDEGKNDEEKNDIPGKCNHVFDDNGKKCTCVGFITKTSTTNYINRICNNCGHSKNDHNMSLYKKNYDKDASANKEQITQAEQAEQIEHLTTELNAYTDEHGKLNNICETLETENTNLKIEIEKNTTDITRLGNENARIKSENDELKTENARIKTENDELKTENDDLAKNLEDKNNHLIIENNDLKEQLTDIVNAAGNENAMLAEQVLKYNTLQSSTHKLIRHVEANTREINNLIIK